MRKRTVAATVFLLISPYVLSTVTYAEDTGQPPSAIQSATTNIDDEFATWQSATVTDSSEVNFTRGTQTFRGKIMFPSIPNGLFKNEIYNTTTTPEVKNTYAYNQGAAGTSFYWIIPPNGDPIKVASITNANYYTKVDENGNKMLARTLTLQNFQIAETLQITPTGAIVHNLKFLNTGTTQLNDYQFRSFLDTQLNTDDRIPIYANGNNGTYIKNTDLTLFSEPVKNTLIYGGTYVAGGNITDAKTTNDVSYGTQLTSSVDSSIAYDSPKVSLAPGQSIEMSFKERVFTNDEKLGHLKIDYLDNTTNQPIKTQSDVVNTVGEAYQQTPRDIPGYHYVRVDGNETGTFQEQEQTLTYYYEKNSVGQPVTVRYVDRNGGELHSAQTIPGVVGAEYDASTTTYRLGIPDYTLDQTKLPLNSRGQITDQPQTVTYVYRKNAQPVTVRYLDKNGQLIPNVSTETINGGVDDPYDATTSTYKKNISGYILDITKLPTNSTGTLSEQGQTVDYVYKKVSKGVTVNYVDQDNVPISEAPSQTIQGNVDDPYDATTETYKKTIPGYDLDETKLPSNGTGVLNDDKQTVTYVYQKKTQATVTYQDQDGTKIPEVPDQLISGHVHDPYDASGEQYKKTIPGYDLDETQLPTNATGTQTDPGQVIPYIYKKIAKNVTVKYVDGTGQTIHKNQVIEGHHHDSYDTTKEGYRLTIPGYDLDQTKLPGNETGTLNDTEQTVTYVYQKIAKPIIVHYKDQDGNEIHPDQQIAGHVGDSYDATEDTYKLTLSGYDLLKTDQAPENMKGTLDDQTKEFTYIYQKIAKNATVKYVDEEGNPLHESQVITGHVHDPYDTTKEPYKVMIPNYQLNQAKLPDNATGKLTDQEQVITYTYQKIAKPVTVKYVDQSGNEIGTEKTITGGVNEDYDTKNERLTIPGYRLDQKKLPTNETGKLGETPQVVTYVYDKLAKKVTIEYLDHEDKTIHPAKEIGGILNDPYDATEKEYKLTIDGYDLDTAKLPSNGTGTLTENEQTVQYRYLKIAKNVTIKYVDEKGKELHPAQVIKGHVVDVYDATTDDYKLTIPDYHLVTTKLPKNDKGKLTDDPQTVIYVYQRKTEPSTTNTTSSSKTPDTSSATTSSTTTETSSTSKTTTDTTGTTTSSSTTSDTSSTTTSSTTDTTSTSKTTSDVTSTTSSSKTTPDIGVSTTTSTSKATPDTLSTTSSSKVTPDDTSSTTSTSQTKTDAVTTSSSKGKQGITSTTSSSKATQGKLDKTNSSQTEQGTATPANSNKPEQAVAPPTYSSDRSAMTWPTGKLSIPDYQVSPATVTTPTELNYPVTHSTPQQIEQGSTPDQATSTNDSGSGAEVTTPSEPSANAASSSPVATTPSSAMQGAAQTSYPQTGESKKLLEVLSLLGAVWLAGLVVVVKRRRKKES